MRFLMSAVVMVTLGMLMYQAMPVDAGERVAAFESGHLSASGEFCVEPHATPRVSSPDGRWEAWVEGWTTDCSGSGPIGTVTTQSPSETWCYWARLLLSERKSGLARHLVASVGPNGPTDRSRFRDLRLVSWSADSSRVLCSYTEGVPYSDVGSNHILLAGPSSSLRIVLESEVVRACKASGVELADGVDWRMSVEGFSPDGRVVVEFGAYGDEGGNVKARRCLVDLLTRQVTEAGTDGTSPAPR